jgi:hypothetical protein
MSHPSVARIRNSIFHKIKSEIRHTWHCLYEQASEVRILTDIPCSDSFTNETHIRPKRGFHLNEMLILTFIIAMLAQRSMTGHHARRRSPGEEAITFKFLKRYRNDLWPNLIGKWIFFCLFLMQHLPVCHGVLSIEVSRSHKTTHHSR